MVSFVAELPYRADFCNAATIFFNKAARTRTEFDERPSFATDPTFATKPKWS